MYTPLQPHLDMENLRSALIAFHASKNAMNFVMASQMSQKMTSTRVDQEF